MSYIVLARKWRPMRFEDLVGQEHVARTLANAIATDRVAHAFLFTGVRGVGKTTAARILAKALNCMRPPGSVEPGTDPGPTATPCLECAACKEITLGTDVDVREIDGASYNGVEEVRKLQDSLPYRPTRDRFKIIIVDEVHMLSQSAWNAFLKTLEEPPAHVKFIFATTEVHKVPITILSRVQRFDFKLINALSIVERLRFVLGEEGIGTDDAALSVIARQAAGSMRDAMSLLDQVIAWGGDQLVGDDVARVLGVASRKALLEVAAKMLEGNAEACLAVVSELVGQGFDMTHVAKDLLEVLRDLVVARVCKEPGALLELSDVEKNAVVELAGQADADDLVRMHQGFSQGYDEVVRSGHPRAALEMLLVRLCRRPPLLPIDDLVARLGALEKRLGATRGGGSTVPPSGAERPLARRAAPRKRQSVSKSSAGEAETSEDPPDAALEPSHERNSERTTTPGREASVAPVSLQPPAAPQTRQVAAPQTRQAAAPQTRQVAASSDPITGASPPLERSAEVTFEALERLRDVVEHVRADRPELAAFLEHAAVIDERRGSMTLAYEPGSIFSKELEDPKLQRLVTEAASTVFKHDTLVEFLFEHPAARGMDTLSADRVRAREERRREARNKAKNHPRVAEAIEVFGAKIKDLRLNEG